MTDHPTTSWIVVLPTTTRSVDSSNLVTWRSFVHKIWWRTCVIRGKTSCKSYWSDDKRKVKYTCRKLNSWHLQMNLSVSCLHFSRDVYGEHDIMAAINAPRSYATASCAFSFRRWCRRQAKECRDDDQTVMYGTVLGRAGSRVGSLAVRLGAELRRAATEFNLWLCAYIRV